MNNPKKILIIEDDANLSMIYKTKFETEGYEPLVALTGQQGVTLAVEHKPDLILLDIMLPEGMNGFDVLQQIKLTQDLKDTPVIILTNLDSERETGMQMGANDYIVKSDTSIDDLVAKAKTYLV